MYLRRVMTTKSWSHAMSWLALDNFRGTRMGVGGSEVEQE